MGGCSVGGYGHYCVLTSTDGFSRLSDIGFTSFRRTAVLAARLCGPTLGGCGGVIRIGR